MRPSCRSPDGKLSTPVSRSRSTQLFSGPPTNCAPSDFSLISFFLAMNSAAGRFPRAEDGAAQCNAIQLESTCDRQLRHHSHLGRALVVDQPGRAVGGNLGHIDLFARSGHDEGDQALATGSRIGTPTTPATSTLL